MRKKMKLERIDYGEHALDVDKKAAAQTAKSIIDQIPVRRVHAHICTPVRWRLPIAAELADGALPMEHRRSARAEHDIPELCCAALGIMLVVPVCCLLVHVRAHTRTSHVRAAGYG